MNNVQLTTTNNLQLTTHKLLDNKSPYSFLVRFLSCFFILYFFFPFYRGVTGIGGKLYSSFLDNHFNIVRGLTRLLNGAARFILEVLHYQVYQPDYSTLRIGNSGGVIVNPSCLGWAVMSFWAAFVFANRGNRQHKLKWILTGIASICILNITRITLIALAAHLHWKTITSLDHHQTFNVLSYGCVFILMYLYIMFQKKYEIINPEVKNHKNKLSAI